MPLGQPAKRTLRGWVRAALALAISTAAAGPERAEAGAWNLPQGRGFALFDFTLGEGGDYFDGQGHRAPARRYAKEEVAGYVEYGATDWLMLVARPSFDHIDIGAPGAGRYTGLGSTSAGAQLHLRTVGPAVLAVQGTFSLPGTTSPSNPATVGGTAREADVRVLAGIGDLHIASLPSFVDLQGGYRDRSGGAAAQWRADLTLGIRPIPRLLVLMQSFTSLPTGIGTPLLPSSRYSKASVSGVYDLSRAWSVQLGVFMTVYGRDALREHGFTTGLWYRF